jgi:hypothetical protein
VQDPIILHQIKVVAAASSVQGATGNGGEENWDGDLPSARASAARETGMATWQQPTLAMA